MIYFRNVSKYQLDAYLGHEVLLRDASFVFPTDRSLAILSESKVASAVLLMMTGSKVPDRGRVERGRLRCSPVINAGGVPGALGGSFTGLENIRMFADRYGVDQHKLAALVEAAGDFGTALNLPVRKLDGAQRRSLETAAIAALPFDCYFVDKIHQIEPTLVWKLLHAAKMRGAGVIFSTERPLQARRLASSGVIVSNGLMQWATNLQETFESHGQAGQSAAFG